MGASAPVVAQARFGVPVYGFERQGWRFEVAFDIWIG